MGWQKTFTLSRRGKGCHLVTDEVVGQIRDGMKDVKVGMLYLFIQHTSAALTINENCDPDVRKDMDMALDKIVPESLNWLHTDEGPDDSVSHTKASILGSTISMPITDGRLNLGTWQGIYLTEFRHMPHARRIVATILT
jgi:secondary thiamine-phosphate synthase enzyme